VDRIRDDLAGRCWGVLKAGRGEFCVPDVPVNGVIPLTPTVLLALDNYSDVITADEVGYVNNGFQSGAQEYLFARKTAACPGISMKLGQST
jgi:hypothetical protein